MMPAEEMPQPRPRVGRLSADDLDVLTVERATWRNPVARAVAIRQLWGYGIDTHEARLRQILAHPDAELFDPITVVRLRRLRRRRPQADG